jgi:hypothetical protein
VTDIGCRITPDRFDVLKRRALVNVRFLQRASAPRTLGKRESSTFMVPFSPPSSVIGQTHRCELGLNSFCRRQCIRCQLTDCFICGRACTPTALAQRCLDGIPRRPVQIRRMMDVVISLRILLVVRTLPNQIVS